jgi:hypothetical protein
MPVESEFKGHPLLVLNPEDRFSFSFGLGKARMILEYIEEIRNFVDSHQGE